jgi:hypothetical protein
MASAEGLAAAEGAGEIAADSVGGTELQGLTKLIFGQCVLTNTEATTDVSTHVAMLKVCNIAGTDSDDSVIVTLNDMNICLDDRFVQSQNGFVRVYIKNECSIEVPPGAGSTIGVIVYDKQGAVIRAPATCQGLRREATRQSGISGSTSLARFASDSCHPR